MQREELKYLILGIVGAIASVLFIIIWVELCLYYGEPFTSITLIIFAICGFGIGSRKRFR